MNRFLLFFLLLLFINVQVFAQYPVLDSTFNDDGIQGYQSPNCLEMAKQSDGKILLSFDDVFYNKHIRRFNSDGSIDSSFGLNGALEVLVDNNYKITVQLDDKIVVLGKDPMGTNILLYRFLPNGSVDALFGIGGVINFAMYNYYPANNPPFALKIQPDGKILALGSTYMPSFVGPVITRFNANGVVDTSFGLGGVRAYNVSTCGFNTKDIFLRDSGKILVIGEYYTLSSLDYGAFKCNGNGSYDSSFGVNGVAHLSGGLELSGYAMQENGKLLMGGRAGTNLFLLRMNNQGLLDSTFGNYGYLYKHADAVNIYGLLGAIKCDSTGKIWLFANMTSNSALLYTRPILYRLLDNGDDDTSFNHSGRFPYFMGYGCSNTPTHFLLNEKEGEVIMNGNSSSCSFNIFYLSRVKYKFTVSIAASNTTATCPEDTVLLFCSTNFPKNWYFNSTLLPDTTSTIKALNSGIYKVVAEQNSAQIDTSDEIQVTYFLAPIASVQQIGDTLTCLNNSCIAYQWFDAQNNIPILTETDKSFHPISSGEYFVKIIDSNGCSAKSAVINYTSLGIETNIGKLVIKTYPNPVKEYIMIDSPWDESHFSFRNVLGEFLLRGRLSKGVSRLDISSLDDGILFLEVSDGNKHNQRLKFLKRSN